MKEFSVLVKETLIKEIKVSAETELEALAAVEDMYNDYKIELHSSDFAGVKFTIQN